MAFGLFSQGEQHAIRRQITSEIFPEMSVKNFAEQSGNLYSHYLDSSQVPTHKNENVVKLMVVGNAGVGKTCFILQWAEDAFNSVYIPTVGKMNAAP